MICNPLEGGADLLLGLETRELEGCGNSNTEGDFPLYIASQKGTYLYEYHLPISPRSETRPEGRREWLSATLRFTIKALTMRAGLDLKTPRGPHSTRRDHELGAAASLSLGHYTRCFDAMLRDRRLQECLT